MRNSDVLTLQRPSLSRTLQFKATTVEIENPTGTVILARMGGLDVPTRDNADRLIAPQSIYQMPSNTNEFAFAFDDPSQIGTAFYPYKVATISYLDRNEPVGAIGSINLGLTTQKTIYGQAVAQKQLLNVSLIAYSGNGIPPGSGAVGTLTIPTGQIAYIVSISTIVYRDVAPTTPGNVQLYVRWTPITLGPVPVVHSQIPSSETALNVNHVDRAIDFGWSNPGDIIDIVRSDNGIGGSCTYYCVVKYMLFPAP